VFTWVLDAVDYGTPQFRKRAFTIASKIGQFDAPVPMTQRRSAGEVINLPVSGNDPLNRWPTPVGVAAERIALVPPCGDKRDIMKLAPALCPPSWVKVGCNATDVWGRIDPTEPANTIRCTFQNPSKGRYLHPTEQRTLSLREGARLQGIPDDWIIEGRNYPAARQIGNGVPIPLARAVASAVKAAIAEVDARSAAGRMYQAA
jgi:DNA (cytosine-5)-methyltransferase 1